MGPKFEVIFISHVISTSSHPSGFSNDARNRPNRIHVLKKHAADLSASKVDSSRDILSKSEVPKVAENVPRHLPHIPFNPEKRRQKKDFFSKKTVSHSYVQRQRRQSFGSYYHTYVTYSPEISSDLVIVNNIPSRAFFFTTD